MHAGDGQRLTPEEAVVHDQHVGAGGGRLLEGVEARVHRHRYLGDFIRALDLQAVHGGVGAVGAHV